ncbi:MAG: hypothetical protein ACFFAZ_15145 [Promethearchaeota archaeon]
MVLPILSLMVPSPFEIPTYGPWMDIAGLMLNMLLALFIRGYLLLVLVGFMIYVTGLSDGLGKILVVAGVAIYIFGPFILDVFAGIIGAGPVTLETATSAWLSLIGMTDAELVFLLVTIGDIVAAVCILSGAIMYFTPLSGNLKSRGQSLMIRALLFAPILAFFHVAPWI